MIILLIFLLIPIDVHKFEPLMGDAATLWRKCYGINYIIISLPITLTLVLCIIVSIM